MRKNRRNPQTAAFYWADGKMLPLEKLGDKELYWNLMYRYAKDIPDPAKFSQEDIRRLRNFSLAENRSRQLGVSLDFFNVVYDSATRQSTESHIKSVAFLGKYTNAHEWIFEPLARVEAKILELAKNRRRRKRFRRYTGASRQLQLARNQRPLFAFVSQLRNCSRRSSARLGTKKYLLGVAAGHRPRRLDDTSFR